MRPPRLVEHLLSRALGSGPDGRSVLGDLAEEHADRARVSRLAAAWWYRREAVRGVAASPVDHTSTSCDGRNRQAGWRSADATACS